jgi:hypothetical protein
MATIKESDKYFWRIAHLPNFETGPVCILLGTHTRFDGGSF